MISTASPPGSHRYIPRPEQWIVSGVTAQPMYVLTSGASPAIDPKDALMNDPDALREMYAEFDEEDRALANMGMAEYCAGLEAEDRE